MNEFLEQFLIEARELVEQGTNDLLVLEQDADSREKIDGLFRAFHTLKGAAGIVEFAPMARALHAAEEVLTEVRNSSRVMSPGTFAAKACGFSAWSTVVQNLEVLTSPVKSR